MMTLKTDLLPWQKTAVEKLRHLRVGALYMDMSTGKTRTGLELIKLRLDAGKATHAVWLCPYNTVPKLPQLFSEHADGWDEHITIIGIESLSTSVKLNARLRAMAQTEKLFLVVDESTMVKNPNALRTRNITTVAERCPYRLILSGTPITRCEADLFAQWYILDWRILGYRSFWSFSANHLEYDEARPGRIRRVLNTDYLAEKIAPYTVEVSRSDCFVLPPKRFDAVYFSLTEEQEAAYGEAADFLFNQIDERKPATIYRLFGALQAITAGFYLRFYGSHFERLSAFPDPLGNPRIRALLTALDRLPGGEKVVINCKYTAEILAIMQVLNGRNPGCAVPFYGDIPSKQRGASLARFENEAQYLVANKSCSQYGLNLQYCHNMVFYNNDWDYATRLQAEDRLHRYGQRCEVRIIDIICDETIDVTIQTSLSRKEGLLDRFKRELKDTTTTKESLRRMIRGVVG